MSESRHTLLSKAGPADPPSPSERATQAAVEDGPSPDPSTHRASAGTVLADRYRLEEPLGQGGVGAVWRATHTAIGHQVAIKLLRAPPNSAAAANHEARLLREAQALSRVKHPNVVDVIDHGFADDGTPFIAMDLIEGPSLFVVLHGPEARPRPWSWRRDVALQILDGLAACHDVDIVHRDVKPENIIVSPRSGATSGPPAWVTLVDFGIALSTHDESSSPRLTRVGSVFGTPMYMSPEQAAGGVVDHRTDVYAFGCVLHELLAGEAPFAGTPSQILAGQIAADPPSLQHLVDAGEFPAGVLEILGRCLAKDPDDRFDSARAVHDALADPRLAETHVDVRPESRRRWWLALGAVAAATGLAFSLTGGSEPADIEAPPAAPIVDSKTPAPAGTPARVAPAPEAPKPSEVEATAAPEADDTTESEAPVNPAATEPPDASATPSAAPRKPKRGRPRPSPPKRVREPSPAPSPAAEEPASPQPEPPLVEPTPSVSPTQPRPDAAENPKVNELRNPFDKDPL